MSCNSLFLASGLLGRLCDFTAGFLGLGHALDDTDSNGLYVTISTFVSYYSMSIRNIPVSCHGRQNVPKVGSR